MSAENRTQNNNPQHPLSNQMIEQINIALEQKEVQEFLNLGHLESLQSETNVRKEHIHQLKVMKNEHPAFFPPNDDIVNSLN